MKYRLVLTSIARQELFESAVWWAQHRSAEQAQRWLDGLEEAFAILTNDPGIFPLAIESRDFPMELRQKQYGLGAKPTHRVIYEVRGRDVVVHGVRHLSREELKPGELSE